VLARCSPRAPRDVSSSLAARLIYSPAPPRRVSPSIEGPVADCPRALATAWKPPRKLFQPHVGTLFFWIVSLPGFHRAASHLTPPGGRYSKAIKLPVGSPPLGKRRVGDRRGRRSCGRMTLVVRATRTTPGRQGTPSLPAALCESRRLDQSRSKGPSNPIRHIRGSRAQMYSLFNVRIGSTVSCS